MALAVVVAGAAVTVFLTSGDKPATATKQQVVDYEAAVLPFLKSGGETVERGMKPAVADLLTLHVTAPAGIAVEARGWVSTLLDVRSSVAAVTPPRGLGEARTLFLQSLDLYVTAARGIGAAADASAGQRPELMTDALAKAREADGTYNKASAVIQGLRHKLGLPPSPDLPEASD